MFTERQRQIYQAPDGRRYDPLRVERELRIAAGGQPRVNGWLDDLARLDDLRGRGGVPDDELLQADVAAAVAEKGLVDASRVAFAFDKSSLDADVLATLTHFLGWLEGKDSPAASGPTSPPATGESAQAGWLVSGPKDPAAATVVMNSSSRSP